MTALLGLVTLIGSNLLLCFAFTKVIVPGMLFDLNAKSPWMTVEQQEKYGVSVFMYQKSHPTKPNYLSSFHGTEGGIHLRYVVEHYDDFPDMAIFVGSSPEARQPLWPQLLGCIRPNASYISISNERVCRDSETWSRYSIWIEQCWRDILSVVWDGMNVVEERLPSDKSVQSCAQCCQQFIISREKVRSRPYEVWKNLLNMIGKRFSSRFASISRYSAVDKVCHKDDPVYDKLYAFSISHAHVGPEKGSYVGSSINANGRLIQGGAMEHLSHVVFGDLALQMPELTNYDYCTNFLPDNVCPGSPCRSDLPKNPPPTPPPSAKPVPSPGALATLSVATAITSKTGTATKQPPQKSKFVPVDPSLKPFPSSLQKVIVPSVYNEWDHGIPDWATLDMQRKFNYSVFLYQKTNASAPNYISTNRGTEGGVYLRYIVDHYESFPDVAVFVHAAPEAHSVKWLNHVNCIRSTASYFNFNEIRVQRGSQAWKYHAYWVEQCWRDVLKVAYGYGTSPGDNAAFLNKVPNDHPITVNIPCCQQFIMSRQMVQARPLKVWKQLHRMIGVDDTCHKGNMEYQSLYAAKANPGLKVALESGVNGAENDHGKLIQGGTMEHLAHVVFGQQPLMTNEPDMLELCKHFEDENKCPGSLCQESKIVTPPPTRHPSTMPSTAPSNTPEPSFTPAPSVLPSEAPVNIPQMKQQIKDLEQQISNLQREASIYKQKERAHVTSGKSSSANSGRRERSLYSNDASKGSSGGDVATPMVDKTGQVTQKLVVPKVQLQGSVSSLERQKSDAVKGSENYSVRNIRSGGSSYGGGHKGDLGSTGSLDNTQSNGKSVRTIKQQ